MRSWPPLLGLICLGPGCAAVGSVAAQALGQAAFVQASPLAPLNPPAGRYLQRSPESGELTLRELAFSRKGVTVLAVVSGDQRRVLRRARLAPVGASPCTAGWVAETLWLGRQQRWDRPVGWSGDHELELLFMAPLALLREPVVLDLSMVGDGKAGDRCLRQRLGGSGADDGLRRSGRASGGGGLGMVLTSGSSGGGMTLKGVRATGSMGAWLGRWRLGGQLEACFGGCDRRSVLTFPLAAMVERLLYVGNRFTLGIALGYQPGRVDDLVSLWQQPRTWVHGPRATLLLLGPRPFAGADAREGFASRGLGLFVSRQFHAVYPAEADETSWLFGLEATAL